MRLSEITRKLSAFHWAVLIIGVTCIFIFIQAKQKQECEESGGKWSIVGHRTVYINNQMHIEPIRECVKD